MSLLGCEPRSMPPIRTSLPGPPSEHVAAQHADQDVVAATSEQHVGVVEALVGGDALGLDLGIVHVVVVASDQDVGAAGSDELRGVDWGRVQGQAEGQDGRDANDVVHCGSIRVGTRVAWMALTTHGRESGFRATRHGEVSTVGERRTPSGAAIGPTSVRGADAQRAGAHERPQTAEQEHRRHVADEKMGDVAHRAPEIHEDGGARARRHAERQAQRSGMNRDRCPCAPRRAPRAGQAAKSAVNAKQRRPDRAGQASIMCGTPALLATFHIRNAIGTITAVPSSRRVERPSMLDPRPTARRSASTAMPAVPSAVIATSGSGRGPTRGPPTSAKQQERDRDGRGREDGAPHHALLPRGRRLGGRDRQDSIV